MRDSLGMRLKNILSQRGVNFLPILYDKSKLKVVKLWLVACVVLARVSAATVTFAAACRISQHSNGD